ncbi:hypothetical protein Bca101_071323 [Brassica carinata]
MVERYELMVQHARGVIKTYEGTLRVLDESDKELVQLEEGYNKMIEARKRPNAYRLPRFQNEFRVHPPLPVNFFNFIVPLSL